MSLWNQRLAIEVGGTFADTSLLRADRSSDGCVSRALKVPSTPRSPEKSVLDQIDQLHLNWNLQFDGDSSVGDFNAQLTANETRRVDLVTPLEANRMSIFW